MNIKSVLISFAVLVLSGCSESVPEDHALFLSTDAEASGCYCAMRMKADTPVVAGRYVHFEPVETLSSSDCDETSEAGRVTVSSNKIAICKGASGWGYVQLDE